MSFVPKNIPIVSDDLIEGAKQAAIQQAGAALLNKVTAAGGKRAQKVAKALQTGQQIYGLKDQFGKSTPPKLPEIGINGPVHTGNQRIPVSSEARVPELTGINGPIQTNKPPAPLTSEPETAASVASSLLPVLVGCDVYIDGLAINPILDLHISQVHGDHNKLEIHFPHRLIQENTFTMETSQSLLGKVVEVSIKNRNDPGSDPLESHFVVTSVTLEQSQLDDGVLVVTGYSPTILLDGAPHYESFHKKTLKDIATIIGKPLQQVKGSITPEPTLTNTLIYTCRYNESAWNFMKRLSAETGQWLYYNGTTLIFGKPEKGKALQLIYGSNCYQLKSRVQAAPVQTSVFDYNAPAHAPLSGAAGSYTGNAGSYAEKAFDKSKELFASCTTCAASTSLDADRSVVEVVGKARSAGRAAGLYVMSGESAIYGLRVGALVDVSFKRLGESAEHSQMRIISVSHHLNASGNYTNSFEAISATAEMPPPPQFTRPVTYPMLAVVLSNQDPQGQGRIQVQFMGWKQDHSSQQTDWIRVLTPDAGGTEAVMQNRGQLFIPEVGDEVLVDFMEGNPDRPYVTGSLYHGNNANEQGGSNNTLKSITTRSGHRVDFDDSGGGTSITITDKSGNTIYFDTQGSNITITAPETMTLNAKNIFVNAHENITTTAGLNITDFAGGHISIAAALTITENAGKDYMLNAENITKTAIMNITSSSDTHSQQAREDIIADSLEGNIYHHAKKEVRSNSGQNTNLF